MWNLLALTNAHANDLVDRYYPPDEYPPELNIQAPDGFNVERDLARFYDGELKRMREVLEVADADRYHSKVSGSDTAWGHLKTTAELKANADLIVGLFGGSMDFSYSADESYGYHRAAWTTTMHQVDPGTFENVPDDALYYVSAIRMGSIHDYWCKGAEEAVAGAINANYIVASASVSGSQTSDRVECSDKTRALTINEGMLEVSRSSTSNFTETYTREGEAPILFTLTRLPDEVLARRVDALLEEDPASYRLKLTAVELSKGVTPALILMLPAFAGTA